MRNPRRRNERRRTVREDTGTTMENDGDDIDQQVIHGIGSAAIDIGIAHGRATGGETAMETTGAGIGHEVVSTTDARTAQNADGSAMLMRSDRGHARRTTGVGSQGANRHTREVRGGETESGFPKSTSSR